MSRIIRSTDISGALRHKQRGFLMNPFRFRTVAPPAAVRTYATWNLADKGSAVALTSNLLRSDSVELNGSCRATIGISSGKWYWEVTLTCVSQYSDCAGIMTATASLTHYVGSDIGGWGWSAFETGGAGSYHNGVKTSFGTTTSTGTYTLGFALDMDAGTLTLYRNGVSMGLMYSGITGTVYPATGGNASSITTNAIANFGETAFTYAPPAGYNSGVYRDDPYTFTDPLSISNCILWLDGNDGATLNTTGTAINSWTDKSASAKVFSQATTANKPNVDSTIFSGKTCVNFGITTNTWLTSASDLSVPVNSTVFVTYQWGNRTTSTSYSSICIQHGAATNALSAGTGVPYWLVYTAVTGGMVNYPGAAAQFSGPGTQNLYITTAVTAKGNKGLMTVRTPNSMKNSLLRVDRAPRLPTYGTTDTLPSPSLVNTIGSSDNLYVVNGAFAEVIIYGRALTDQEMRQVENYLRTKWGTP